VLLWREFWTWSAAWIARLLALSCGRCHSERSPSRRRPAWRRCKSIVVDNFAQPATLRPISPAVSRILRRLSLYQSVLPSWRARGEAPASDCERAVMHAPRRRFNARERAGGGRRARGRMCDICPPAYLPPKKKKTRGGHQSRMTL